MAKRNASGGGRTHNLWLRRPTLYPIELRVRNRRGTLAETERYLNGSLPAPQPRTTFSAGQPFLSITHVRANAATRHQARHRAAHPGARRPRSTLAQFRRLAAEIAALVAAWARVPRRHQRRGRRGDDGARAAGTFRRHPDDPGLRGHRAIAADAGLRNAFRPARSGRRATSPHPPGPRQPHPLRQRAEHPRPAARTPAASCRSSTKTTAWPSRNCASATTTGFRRKSPSWRARTC